MRAGAVIAARQDSTIVDFGQVSVASGSQEEQTVVSTAIKSQTDGSKVSDMNVINDQHSNNNHDDTSTNSEALQTQQTPNTFSCDKNMMEDSAVFFSFYRYLRAPNLHQLQPAEMLFLESQKSLHVPTGPLLDTLISHYFLYVHPCLPIINEAEFWPMFHGTETEGSPFSLLVFQAMLFVACSYISLTDAKKSGAESILIMRNTFYRRAKMLYDFGIEGDNLCLSRALLLLTYQSTRSDHLSNTTWLVLAIQQARAANAHLYRHYPAESKYKRSDLKRLWWCVVVRDRIIALGMRRPLQILPAHFDTTSRDLLLVDDLYDEVYSSKVYDPESKIMLCKIMTSQCQLALALTDLIMIVYPPGIHMGPQNDLTSEETRIDEIKSRLNDWKSQNMLQLSPEDSCLHACIVFYKQLTVLYFETARLALYHHISFRIYQRQHRESWPDLMDAVTKINDTVKRFVVDGTAGHLPISVAAYTVLPQIVLNFNLRLSKDGIGRRRQEHTLRLYNELNRQHFLRYDVSHVTLWFNHILRIFESSVSCTKNRAADVFRSQRLSLGKPCSYMLETQPEIYFKLTGIMDALMATGQLSVEHSETMLILPPAELSMPQIYPELAVISPTRLQSTPHQIGHSMKFESAWNTGSTVELPRQKDTDIMVGPSVGNLSSDDIYYTLEEEDGDMNDDRLIPISSVSIGTLCSSIALFGE
ncbi:hypothetical protein PENVUL_c033G05563 [Penicillium vulpinum]|uniref:Xylanolytic transcriptional activator regulatory domain-containing protein n=1 Tax=Penicillium vulpinum TaxID=29845 RepID=A0A1V6RRK5_9EURO|nr:hypothetical protein PENVUL_c033G05563 [Penicillium vulpinum]